MSEQYKHLPIEKAPLINDRRTTKSGFPPPPARNLPSHSDKLKHDLRQSIGLALRQTAASPDRLVFKFSYSGYIDLNNLEKHGVNFISQEDKEVCVVFSDEKGLAKFEDHLSRLALNDDDLTYKGILEALEGIDNWTAEDRTSWAIKNRGLPSEDLFKLDIELWPLATSSHPIRNQLCEDFDSWLNNHNIRRLDRVNLDSLLIYRLEATQAGAEALLDHIDVRLVDWHPSYPPKVVCTFFAPSHKFRQHSSQPLSGAVSYFCGHSPF